MANKWAIQNGNWSDGSTWNDGVVPTADDDVWLNGCTVTYTITELSFKSLNNGLSPDNRVGGTLTTSDWGTKTIHGKINIWNYSTIISNSGNINFTLHIIGDIEAKEDLMNYVGINIHNGSTQWMGSVNGDIYGGNVINLQEQYSSYTALITPFTINGNIINNSETPTIIKKDNSNNQQLTVNGNVYGPLCTWRNRGSEITQIVINGNVYSDNRGFITYNQSNSLFTSDIVINGDFVFDSLLTANRLQVHRYIGYKTTPFKICVNQFIIEDELNAEIQYVGSLPNPNPYIIINPNLIANTYPQETDVSEGVIYGASMEKEGTLTLPIESLVMKGVEYGGDKTGTLEVIALSGATATADNISVVNLTEQQLQRVGNCATIETVQKCFEDFKE